MVQIISRRSFLAAAGMTTVGGCSHPLTSRPTPSLALNELSGSWPIYRFDAAHTATVPSTTAVQALTPVWTHIPSLPFNSQPVLLNNTIYTATPDGSIYALEAHTGKEKWTATLENTGVDYSPAVTDNRLILSTTTEMIAYDHSGAFKWRIPLDGTPVAPTIHDGVGYAASTELGSLTRFNPRNGSTDWMLTTNPTEHAPTVDDTYIYTAEYGGDIFARRTTDGATVWHSSLPNSPSTTVVLSDGRAYIGTHAGHLVALTANTGEEEWAYQVESQNRLYAPVVTSDSVYSVDLRGTVYAFTHTGELRWVYYTKGDMASNVLDQSPTRSGDILFTLSPDHIIHAFDITTSHKRPDLVATAQIGNVTTTPIIVDGVLFTAGSDLKALVGHR